MTDLDSVHVRLGRVTAAIQAVHKTTSQGVSYQFRSIDAVMGALHPHLAAEGITLAVHVADDWQVNAIPGTNNRVQHQALFRVRLTATGPAGDTADLGTGLAQSHDYSDKATYQAQQNAVKYLLLTAFSIPTDEPDMDGRAAPVTVSARAAGLRARLDDVWESKVVPAILDGGLPDWDGDIATLPLSWLDWLARAADRHEAARDAAGDAESPSEGKNTGEGVADASGDPVRSGDVARLAALKARLGDRWEAEVIPAVREASKRPGWDGERLNSAWLDWVEQRFPPDDGPALTPAQQAFADYWYELAEDDIANGDYPANVVAVWDALTVDDVTRLVDLGVVSTSDAVTLESCARGDAARKGIMTLAG